MCKKNFVILKVYILKQFILIIIIFQKQQTCISLSTFQL